MEKKEKKLLAGIVLLLFLAAVIIGFLLISKKQSPSNISDLIAESLIETDFDFFNGDKSKMQNAANAAVPILDERSSQNASKEEMVKAVSSALFKSSLGLSQKEAERLAEWIVDFYLQNIENNGASFSQSSTDSTATNQETILTEQIKQDLTNISEYLTQLDKTVIQNKEEILNLTTGQSNELEQLSTYLQSLQKSISSLQSQFAAYENNYNTELNVTSTEFGNIKLQIDSVQENLEKIQNDISENIHNTDINNAERYESLNSTIHTFASSLREKLDSVNSDITKILNRIQETNSEQNEMLIAELQKSQEEIQLILNSMDTEISAAFDQMSQRIDIAEANVSSSLQNTEDNISDQLESSEKTLTDDLQNSESRISDQINNTEKNLTDKVQDSADSLSSQIGDSEKQLASHLEDTKNEINSKIDSAENNLTSKTQEIKDSLSEQIDTTGKNLASDLSNTQKELGEKIDNAESNLADKTKEAKDSLTSQMSNAESNLSSDINKAKEELQKQTGISESNITQGIDSGINSLLTNLDNVHSDISSTQGEIKDILSAIDTADTSRMAQIIAQFTGINNKLAEINSAMDSAHTEIKLLISSLEKTVRTTGENNKQELLSALTTINNSFSNQTSENFTQLVNSLKTQTEGIQNWFNSLDESVTRNFEDLSNTVSTFEQSTSANMEELVSNFNQSFTKLSATVDSINQVTADNKDAILNRISELEISTSSSLGKVETELQSVFQRASDGKKLLASALLAKNVSAKEDATFRELYEAILSIDQQIVIGVEQVPGTISFEYHYHTGDPENGGGCYTKKLYHQHGPECYSKATCTVTVHASGGFFSEGDDWCPCHGNVHRIKQNVIRKHSSCGAADNYGQISFTEHHGPGTDGFNGYNSSTHSYDKLSCGKTNATFVGWDVGCGMVDGQIIAAHIIYDQSAVPRTLSSRQSKPVNYIPKVYDDYVMTDSSDHGSQGKPEEKAPAEEESNNEKESPTEAEDASRPETETSDETENTTEVESPTETESSAEAEISTEQNSVSVPAPEEDKPEENSFSDTVSKSDSSTVSETE